MAAEIPLDNPDVPLTPEAIVEANELALAMLEIETVYRRDQMVASGMTEAEIAADPDLNFQLGVLKGSVEGLVEMRKLQRSIDDTNGSQAA